LFEDGDEFFDGVELFDGVFEALIEIGDGGAHVVAGAIEGVEDAFAGERVADAAEGIGEGAEFGGVVLCEVAEEAEERAEAWGDEGPAVLEAEGLFFEPAGGEHAVEEDGGALADVAEGGSFVVAEDDVRVLGDDFADDGDGVAVGEACGFTGFGDEAVGAIDVDGSGRPRQRSEEFGSGEAEEALTQRGHGLFGSGARGGVATGSAGKAGDGGWVGGDRRDCFVKCADSGS
jgi:hypothetical protein